MPDVFRQMNRYRLRRSAVKYQLAEKRREDAIYWYTMYWNLNRQNWKRGDGGGDDDNNNNDDDDDDDDEDDENFQFSLKLGSSKFELVANASVVYGFMLTFFILLQC
jgi:hypothetical protein